jgi:hypothetical protein
LVPVEAGTAFRIVLPVEAPADETADAPADGRGRAPDAAITTTGALVDALAGGSLAARGSR